MTSRAHVGADDAAMSLWLCKHLNLVHVCCCYRKMFMVSLFSGHTVVCSVKMADVTLKAVSNRCQTLMGIDVFFRIPCISKNNWLLVRPPTRQPRTNSMT